MARTVILIIFTIFLFRLIDEKKLTHNENLPGNQMSNYNSKASNYKSNYLNKDDLGSSNKNQIMINPSSSLSSLYNRNVEVKLIK